MFVAFRAERISEIDLYTQSEDATIELERVESNS